MASLPRCATRDKPQSSVCQPQSSVPEAMDLATAASYLGVAKVRVRRWAWKGLKSTKGPDGQVLFTREALHEFLGHARQYNEKKARPVQPLPEHGGRL